jgi:hypothetical protein
MLLQEWVSWERPPGDVHVQRKSPGLFTPSLMQTPRDANPAAWLCEVSDYTKRNKRKACTHIGNITITEIWTNFEGQIQLSPETIRTFVFAQ